MTRSHQNLSRPDQAASGTISLQLNVDDADHARQLQTLHRELLTSKKPGISADDIKNVAVEVVNALQKTEVPVPPVIPVNVAAAHADGSAMRAVVRAEIERSMRRKRAAPASITVSNSPVKSGVSKKSKSISSTAAKKGMTSVFEQVLSKVATTKLRKDMTDMGLEHDDASWRSPVYKAQYIAQMAAHIASDSAAGMKIERE